MSVKRRRAINIDKAIIESLKIESQRLGLKSHTALASKIFVGEARAISISSKAGKSLGVSMRESLWLSIRSRASSRNVSNVSAAHGILLGEDPPLRREEIEEGLNLARIRESERAKEPKKDKPKKPRLRPEKKAEKKVEEKPLDTIIEPDETPEEAEERKLRQAKLPKGTPLETSEENAMSALKELNPGEEEYLGGVYSL